MKDIYNIYESLLSDIDDQIISNDGHFDAMCKLNWRLSYFNTKQSKDVRGGRKGVVEKYFGKKLEPITVSLHTPYAKDYDLAEKYKETYKNPSMWFEAIILNAKYDKPIDDCLPKVSIYPYSAIDDKLEYEFNSRLLPEYKKMYEEGNPIIQTYTRRISKIRYTEIIITIYLTAAVLRADMDNDYGKLCEITYRFYKDPINA